MPICSANCCLCGAPVDESPRWPEWMGRFRAVCTLDEQWTAAFVSGAGQRHGHNDLVPNPALTDAHRNAGSEADLSPAAEQSDSIEEDTMEIDICSSEFGDQPVIGPGQRIWGFPFHCSCWDLLIARSETQGTAEPDPQALFDVLRSFPRHSLSELGHDYGGVAGYDIEVDLFDIVDPSHRPPHLAPGEELRLVYDHTDPALLDMQKQDPMSVAEITSIFNGKSPRGSSASEAYSVQPLQKATANSSDPFSKLPVELLQFIISELSSPEVVALKQSSRVFQQLPLPDTFWRSRFLTGREFEYVFEAFQYHNRCNGQWKAFYQHLRHLRKSPGLVNRQRIWNLARTLNDLLEPRLENPICIGIKDYCYFEPAVAEDNDAVWVGGHRCLRPFNQDFATGCRELHIRKMLVPPYTANIYVSIVHILDKSYVCGLRFEESRGTIQEMGYIRPKNEIPLPWNTQQEPGHVTGFHLALDQRGVRGLCVVSGTNEMSAWAGQYDGIPKRRLVLPLSQQGSTVRIEKLKAGFDALKLVSLSLSPHDGDSTTLVAPTRPPLRETALWFPEIPDPRLSFAGITMNNLRRDDSGRHQRPLSMLIFGARDGAQVNHLECLTFLMQEDHGLMGLDATFKGPLGGKDSAFIGSNIPCVPLNRRSQPQTLKEYKMSFDISAGELLLAVDVLQGHYVMCLKVYTSLGRVVEFPPPEESEWDMDTRAEDEGEMISVKPDTGRVVGFLMRAGSNGVQNLGLVYIEE